MINSVLECVTNDASIFISWWNYFGGMGEWGCVLHLISLKEKKSWFTFSFCPWQENIFHFHILFLFNGCNNSSRIHNAKWSSHILLVIEVHSICNHCWDFSLYWTFYTTDSKLAIWKENCYSRNWDPRLNCDCGPVMLIPKTMVVHPRYLQAQRRWHCIALLTYELLLSGLYNQIKANVRNTAFLGLCFISWIVHRATVDIWVWEWSVSKV